MDNNLSLHDALPSMLSCLQTKATNPFGNGCMLATVYQQHSSIGDSGSAVAVASEVLLPASFACQRPWRWRFRYFTLRLQSSVEQLGADERLR